MGTFENCVVRDLTGSLYGNADVDVLASGEGYTGMLYWIGDLPLSNQMEYTIEHPVGGMLHIRMTESTKVTSRRAEFVVLSLGERSS
jgi:hypothetical protein